MFDSIGALAANLRWFVIAAWLLPFLASAPRVPSLPEETFLSVC